MFVKLKTQTGALFPFEGREKSTEWVGEENARRINWGHRLGTESDSNSITWQQQSHK